MDALTKSTLIPVFRKALSGAHVNPDERNWRYSCMLLVWADLLVVCMRQQVTAHPSSPASPLTLATRHNKASIKCIPSRLCLSLLGLHPGALLPITANKNDIIFALYFL